MVLVQKRNAHFGKTLSVWCGKAGDGMSSAQRARTRNRSLGWAYVGEPIRRRLFQRLLGGSSSTRPSTTTPFASGSQRTRRTSFNHPLINDPTPKKQSSSETIVTYRVHQFAKGLFYPQFKVVGKLPSILKKTRQQPPDTASHPGNHGLVIWGDETAPSFYDSVTIDGVEYNAGDSVIIEPGHDSNANRQENAEGAPSKSANRLANTKWFAKICFFFERRGRKLLHVQWYQHGAQILLQETAHTHGLFLINECDDLELDCIYGKCNLRVLEPTDEEPLPGSSTQDNDFFTGLTWDQDDACFMEVTPEEHSTTIQACDHWRQCYPCGIQILEIIASQWEPTSDGGLRHLGVTYHPQDFVYLRPKKSTHAMYKVAQIIEFCERDDEWYAKVRIYLRYSDLVKREGAENIVADEKRLYKTGWIINDKTVNCIDSKIFVAHPKSLPSSQFENWLDHDDHFFADLYTEMEEPDSLEELDNLSFKHFECCVECFEDRSAALEEQHSLLERHGPLRGLELFAGAGGLSTGFNLTGFVDTRWAVEYNPSAALTYGINHPQTVVYNQSSNDLLRHAIETFEGKMPRPLTTLNDLDPEILPAMPMPGDVDLIYGGPPCQSFSGMNHHKKQDDIRSTLPCNMLSYVEFYHPQYFLLENVHGMVHYKLMNSQEEPDTMVQMGVVKLILRALIGLGYQVRFKLLQAAQYGAPQSRRRVIFWGARRDVPLPSFPFPTHFYESTHHVSLATGDKLKPPTRVTWFPGEEDPLHHQCAPFPSVTAMDAISDLPPFDWINPHIVIKEKSQDTEDSIARIEQGIEQLDAVYSSWGYTGYTNPVAYPQQPLNRYQLQMRKNMGNKDKVQYHYSSRFKPLVVERVVAVPLTSKANHRDLPPKLALQGFQHPSQYCRIDKDGQFATALTKVYPGHKGGQVLHPTQKRIITVRECARSQGFPDHYKFKSTEQAPGMVINDYLKQIGNAVPISLAMALGKELGKALVVLWKRQDMDTEMGREVSPEVEMYSSDAY